jgi:predicted HicB family RNase H-like nuclease
MKMKNEKTILLRVDKETHLGVKLAAAVAGVSVNVLVQRIIKDELGNELVQAREVLAGREER